MAVREGKWRCPYCSTVNPGRDLSCSGCGATRDKDVTFFLEEDASEVTDAALLGRARSGADWLCPFCGTSSRADEARCSNCGAERGSAPSRPVGDLPPRAPVVAAPLPGRASPLRWLAALALLLVAGFCHLNLRKTEETVTVSGFRWTRAIDVEAYRTLRETAWEGEVPAGARVVSRSREVHHNDHERVGTQRVKVGTKDLGNGFFQDVYEERPMYRDRPVYRNRLGYDIERWVTDRAEKAEGRDQSPRWPDVRLGVNERQGSRRETYLVGLRGSRDYEMELAEGRWSSLREGETFHAVIRGGRKVLELK